MFIGCQCPAMLSVCAGCPAGCKAAGQGAVQGDAQLDAPQPGRQEIPPKLLFIVLSREYVDEVDLAVEVLQSKLLQGSFGDIELGLQASDLLDLLGLADQGVLDLLKSLQDSLTIGIEPLLGGRLGTIDLGPPPADVHKWRDHLCGYRVKPILKQAAGAPVQR